VEVAREEAVREKLAREEEHGRELAEEELLMLMYVC
jgi:hypothetical protein